MANAASPNVVTDTKNGRQAVTRWLKANLLVILIIADILLVSATGLTVTKPTEVASQVLTQQVKHQVSFQHSAQMKGSTLFPIPQRISQQQRYVVKLIDRFYISVRATSSIKSASPVSGSIRMMMRLTAGELWEREYTLLPERPFAGTGEIELLNDTYEIPINQLWAFADMVGKEADIRPGNYTVTVIPLVITNTDQVGGSAQEFLPSYSFELSERELIPRGSLTANGSDPKTSLLQEKVYSTKQTHVIPAFMKVLLWDIPVVNMRWGFGVTATVLVIFTLIVRKQYPKPRFVVSEAQSISKKYRSRIVTAAGAVSIKGLTLVPLKSFKELLAIADEREKSIICLDDPAATGTMCRFCVLDEWTVFCYQALADSLNNSAEYPVPDAGIGASS